MSNETIGSVSCEACGVSADVAQTKRGKGRYLYTRCPECGTDQRTGKAVQTRLWHSTVWREGKKPLSPPPNVSERQEQPEKEPKQELEDFLPTTEKEPIAEEKKNFGVLKTIATVAGLGLVVVAASLKGA